MIKNFNRFTNEKKVETELDDIFSDINKHILMNSAVKAKNLLTKDLQVIISNNRNRYYFYENGIVKMITVSGVSKNITYNIISDTDKGIYTNPEKNEIDIKKLNIYKSLKNLSKEYNLNYSEILNKLKKRNFKIGDTVEHGNIRGKIINIDQPDDLANKAYIIDGEDGKNHPILAKYSDKMKKIN